MEPKLKYVAVGSFVLTLLLSGLAAAIWLSNYDFKQGKIYAIYFEGSVSGLRTNELVTYNGVPIGTVKKIDIDPNRLEAIRVLVEIEKPDLIRRNSRASLEVKGISGNLFIRIHASTPDQPLLCCETDEQYPVIMSEYSAFQKLLRDAPRIISSLSNLAEHITPFFDDQNRAAFQAALKGISSLTHDLKKETKGSLYEFTQFVREMRSVSSSLNRILNRLEDNPRQFLLQGEREDGYVIAP